MGRVTFWLKCFFPFKMEIISQLGSFERGSLATNTLGITWKIPVWSGCLSYFFQAGQSSTFPHSQCAVNYSGINNAVPVCGDMEQTARALHSLQELQSSPAMSHTLDTPAWPLKFLSQDIFLELLQPCAAAGEQRGTTSWWPPHRAAPASLEILLTGQHTPIPWTYFTFKNGKLHSQCPSPNQSPPCHHSCTAQW